MNEGTAERVAEAMCASDYEDDGLSGFELETRIKLDMTSPRGDRLRRYARVALRELTPTQMTAKDFCAWMEAMKITGAEAAALLGVNPNTIVRYRSEGAPKKIALACAALFHRLPEWHAGRH